LLKLAYIHINVNGIDMMIKDIIERDS